MKKHFLMLGLVLGLAACGTSPEPDFYALAVQPGAAAADIAVIVKIQDPTVAGYLDRPAFVSQDGEYQLSIDDMSHWAEPMDSMFARVLAGDLQQRMPASTVLTENNGTPPQTRFIVDVTLQRFNRVGGGVLMKGEMIVRDKNMPGAPQPVPLHLTAETGSSPEDVTEAMSTLVAHLADQLAHRLALIGKPAPDANAS